MVNWLCHSASRCRRWTTLAPVLLVASLATAELLGQAKAPQENATDQYNTIYLCKPDGSVIRPFVDAGDYKVQGSPTWSQDGTLVAFDAWRPRLSETNSDSKIIVCNADGTNHRVLGDGAMPSFSPRHHRIAFSRYSPNYGVWVMSSEGPDKELVLLDEQGWCARWSPNGKQIAYTTNSGDGSKLVVFDLVEGVKVSLFEDGASPFSTVYWNYSWSPDGKYIVFRGQRTDGKFEVAMIDATGTKKRHVTRLDADAGATFAWSHDSKQILFSKRAADRGNRLQLYLMNAETKDPPELLPGQDPARLNASGVFSHDGKQLLIVSRARPPTANAAEKAKTAD